MNTGSELTVSQHCKDLRSIGDNFDEIIAGFNTIIRLFLPSPPITPPINKNPVAKSPQETDSDNYIIPYLLIQENRLGNQISDLRGILNFFKKQFHGLCELGNEEIEPPYTIQEGTSEKPRFSRF
jgi:hypothetical protein